MVRPTQEGRARPLSDAESLVIGDGTTVGTDGIDFDGGGGSDPGAGGVIVAPAAEQLEVVPDGGSGVALDFSTANWWDITLNANCTLTITNAPASGTVGRLHVILRQGGVGGWTVTWPAEVEWPDTDGTSGGPAGTLHTAVDARDEVELITEDGGTSYGATLGSGLTSIYELNIEGGQDVIKAHGSMGSTETFDPTDGNVHTGTLNANCTFTLSAPSGSGACTLELWLTEDGTGGWTVTWPGSVTQQGTHDTTLGTTQRVILETIDGGTSWIATWVGSSAVAALDDLTDVTITTPATADRLRFDGSVWRNSALIWRPVMVLDPTSGNYLPVTASGDAVMTEA
jgi:hypothetical protein